MQAFEMREGLTLTQLDGYMSNPQIVRFDANIDIENVPDDEVCCICVEKLNNAPSVKLTCRHLFHEDCIRRWLLQKASCPFCNVDVRQSF